MAFYFQWVIFIHFLLSIKFLSAKIMPKPIKAPGGKIANKKLLSN